MYVNCPTCGRPIQFVLLRGEVRIQLHKTPRGLRVCIGSYTLKEDYDAKNLPGGDRASKEAE